MSSEHLKEITPEQRAEMLEKARQSREQKKKAGEHLKQQWLDENYWRELASEAGVRLAQRHIPCSETKHIKRCLKAVGIEMKDYLEAVGCITLKELVELNPTTPAFAIQGEILEMWKEK